MSTAAELEGTAFTGSFAPAYYGAYCTSSALNEY